MAISPTIPTSTDCAPPCNWWTADWGLTADDEAMVTFLRGNDIPFFAVATKVDKLNATERRENLAAIAAHPC